MTQKMALNWKWTWLAAALALAGCSKEKTEETPAAAAPPPAVEKAPGPLTIEETPQPSAPDAVATAPAAAQRSGAVRARFDGYTQRVARNLWQTVPLTQQAAQYALLVPTAPVPEGAASLQAGGPENIALATEGALLKTGDGRPLVVGQEYEFVFTQDAAGVWSVAITRAR